MLNIPYYSLRDIPGELRTKYAAIFENVVKNDYLIDGESCSNFEQKFSSYLGVKHVIGVGNGFDALRIALLALGVGKGDRVAVPAHTFIATWFAVESIGAITVGIDVEGDGQINLELLEREQDLKCVIPVHMHGTHCDMLRLTTWAKKNRVLVLEDCAQATGLDIQGRKAGSWGDVAAFSFYPTKNLFCLGDGGAVVTSQDELAQTCRSISRYGRDLAKAFSHPRLGCNSRLDSLQAAILTLNLDKLDQWNNHRRTVASLYDTYFNSIRPRSNMPKSHIFHHFQIDVGSRQRDNIREFLRQLGIETLIHYQIPASKESTCPQVTSFPIAENISNSYLSLPISPWQSTETTLVIARAVNETLSLYN